MGRKKSLPHSGARPGGRSAAGLCATAALLSIRKRGYKALLAIDELPARANRDAIQYVQCTKTAHVHTCCLEGVYQVPPGHWLKVDGSRLERSRYWDIALPVAKASERMQVVAFRKAFDQGRSRNKPQAMMRSVLRLVASIPQRPLQGCGKPHHRELSIPLRQVSGRTIWTWSSAQSWRVISEPFITKLCSGPTILEEILPYLVWLIGRSGREGKTSPLSFRH